MIHTRRRRLQRRDVVCFLAALLLWILWLAGQISRDRCILSAMLFYLPTPLVVFALFGSSIFCCMEKRLRLALIVFILSLQPLIFLLCVENSWTRTAISVSSRPHFRLVHWNVYEGKRGWNGIGQVLRRQGADLCVLSDLPDDADIAVLSKRFGIGTAALRMDSMAVLARGRILRGKWLARDRKLGLYDFFWEWKGQKLRVFAVDVAADPLVARNPILARVTAFILRHRPDIVVGDFNSPRRSLALCPLPRGYVHAYVAAGSGWSYTWPVPVPVYAIDQCIAGDRITPIRYTLHSTPLSDHRLQVLDFLVHHNGANGHPRS